MLNYLKSELYRILHKKSSYLFIAICSLLLLSSNVILALVNQTEGNFPYASTKFALSNFMTSQVMVYILCVTVASLIFGGEYVNRTMKNSISFGLSRETIYFGKLIAAIAYAIIAFAIIYGVHTGSAYLLLENSGPEYLKMSLQTIAAVLPFFLFALAATNCFFFMFESNGLAIGSVLGLMIGLPIVSNYLGMKFEFFANLSGILPLNLMNRIDYDFSNALILLPFESNPYLKFWLAGMIQMIIMIILGVTVFRKKELK